MDETQMPLEPCLPKVVAQKKVRYQTSGQQQIAAIGCGSVVG